MSDQSEAFWQMPELPIEASAAMSAVYDWVRRIAPSDAPVLITGERGTGKPHIARLVHEKSPRARGAFVTVRWPELTEAFVESQLFGAVPGAQGDFPGGRGGLLEEAHRGALFLEEISDFSLATQRKLLRYLREGAFERLGGHTLVRPDARLIVATSHDPAQLAEQGRLNPALFEALRVLTVHVPPLRECKADILPLANAFLHRHARLAGRTPPQLGVHAVSALLAHGWPGNLHELDQCMERAALVCEGRQVKPEHLPGHLRAAEDMGASEDSAEDLQATLDNVERALIIDALRRSHGNQARAAHLLGITERLMGLRVRKYGIDPKSFRTGR